MNHELVKNCKQEPKPAIGSDQHSACKNMILFFARVNLHIFSHTYKEMKEKKTKFDEAYRKLVFCLRNLASSSDCKASTPRVLVFSRVQVKVKVTEITLQETVA